MVLLSEGSSAKESPEDNKPLPLVPGEAHLSGGPIFSVKSGLVPEFSGGQNILLHRGSTSIGVDVYKVGLVGGR